jgi:hypothetical protein
MAARVTAEVQAMCIMALQRPRSLVVVREKVLEACKRPRFAEIAVWKKPVGGKTISGLSIRFAEEALRCLGNAIPETQITYEDDEKRMIAVSVHDLENNLKHTKSICIEKIVERKNNKDREVLGQRTNTYGETVYIVRATEDEIANKSASAEQKAMRQIVLRILPGDIQDDALAQIALTAVTNAAQDPKAAVKKLADAFATLGVKATALAAYLGHPVDDCTPDEIVGLRTVWAALNDGEAKWSEVMEARDAERAGEVKAPPAPPPSAAAEAVKVETVATAPAEAKLVAAAAPAGDEAKFIQAVEMIESAKSLDDLQMLVPMMKAFTGTNLEELRALYKVRKDALAASGDGAIK